MKRLALALLLLTTPPAFAADYGCVSRSGTTYRGVFQLSWSSRELSLARREGRAHGPATRAGSAVYSLKVNPFTTPRWRGAEVYLSPALATGQPKGALTVIDHYAAGHDSSEFDCTKN